MRKYILIVVVALVLSACGATKDKQISVPENNKNMNTNSNQNSNVGVIKTYKLEEVANHADKSSCWLASNGKVYDVTSFTDKHPGGEKILEGCGKDMTEFFNTKHAKQSKEQLPAFYIGDLK